MHGVPAGDWLGGQLWRLANGHRQSGSAPLRAILKGFESPLVSMPGVGYHKWAPRFQGTTGRRVGFLYLTPHRCPGMDEVTKV
jgi:hypothetical protein